MRLADSIRTRLKMARARPHVVGTSGWIVLACSAFSVVAGAAYLRSESRIHAERGRFLDTPGRRGAPEEMAVTNRSEGDR
jgi:hypothetical protein